MSLPPQLSLLLSWAQAHRRGLGWGLSAALTGLTATAFGLAPLAPDAADLPKRTVSEAVQPTANVTAQVEALAEMSWDLYRADVTRRQDTPETLLRRLGVTDPAAAAFLRQDRAARKLFEGKGQKSVNVRADTQGRLVELVARYGADPRLPTADMQFTRLTVSKGDKGWTSKVETADLETQVRLGSGSIRTSLFAATDEAGMPDAVAAQMTEIFSGDIDFHRELKPGDTFSIVYETLTADGEPVNWGQTAGRVLAAEFVNNGRTHQAIWFHDGGRGAYYNLKGESRQRAFLASPMAFSRVTSGFAMRFHPVHQRMMAHTGIDYAAPTGTPARSVGDGVVEFAGWKPEYGQTVIVRHTPDKTTWYAHLSRIDVRRGERIAQGRQIGAVGATGTATGPHLHFEFRVKDKYIDPNKAMRHAQAAPLAENAKGAFNAHAQVFKAKLDVAATLAGTSERGE